ncbi:MAG: hypothetical protein N2322_06865, partial [Terrimicrobiaceae bacterium]|nr:hypothetical protein [Terrimicrobiaceae bacterium]
MSRGRLGAIVAAAGLAASWAAGIWAAPRWEVVSARVDARQQGGQFFVPDGKGGEAPVTALSPASSALWAHRGGAVAFEPPTPLEYIETDEGLHRVEARRHWGPWSLLPAALAVVLCFLLREPVAALALGLVSGALLTSRYDITGQVLSLIHI